MRKLAFFVILLFSCVSTFAGNDVDSLHRDRLNYKKLNFLYNMYDGSSNPVSLSFNKVQTLTSATVNTQFLRGKLHAIDKSSKHNDLSVDISGLKHTGNFSLSGRILYLNSKDYNHQWNSTLMLTTENPFILCDSVRSDVSLEQFTLQMGAAYQFSNRFATAIRLKYITGSSSDQTDPRPKTNAMHFIINPGIWMSISPQQNFGVATDVDIYRSDISHAVINTLKSNSYFLMKGMGDNTVFTTNDNVSYPRNYKGWKVGGNLEWQMKAREILNLMELGFHSLQEDAEDGGSAYTYKGGDYRATQYSFYDRFTIGIDRNLIQNIILSGNYISGKSYWYDQQRKVDINHANLVYYEILNKSKIQEANYGHLTVEYTLDKLSEKKMFPLWSIGLKAGINPVCITHYEAEAYKQKYNSSFVSCEADRNWDISGMRLTTKIGAIYITNLGNPVYATVRGKLENVYEAPQFDYLTSSKAGFNGRLALDIPIRFYHTPTWLTIYSQVSCLFYAGDHKYSDLLESSSRTVANFGLSITL